MTTLLQTVHQGEELRHNTSLHLTMSLMVLHNNNDVVCVRVCVCVCVCVCVYWEGEVDK